MPAKSEESMRTPESPTSAQSFKTAIREAISSLSSRTVGVLKDSFAILRISAESNSISSTLSAGGFTARSNFCTLNWRFIHSPSFSNSLRSGMQILRIRSCGFERAAVDDVGGLEVLGVKPEGFEVFAEAENRLDLSGADFAREGVERRRGVLGNQPRNEGAAHVGGAVGGNELAVVLGDVACHVHFCGALAREGGNHELLFERLPAVCDYREPPQLGNFNRPVHRVGEVARRRVYARDFQPVSGRKRS